MLRVLGLAVLGLCLVSASQLRAEDWTWSKDHPEAKARLLKIFVKYPNFREALTKFSVEHHGIFQDMVDYLAEKKDHSVEGFIKSRKRDDKDTPDLKRIHDNHKDAWSDFRDFVKDHKEAAVALSHHERELEHLDAVAERRER